MTRSFDNCDLAENFARMQQARSNYALERSGHAPVFARARRAVYFAPSARSRRWLPAAQRDR
jgi:hypothetical protein